MNLWPRLRPILDVQPETVVEERPVTRGTCPVCRSLNVPFAKAHVFRVKAPGGMIEVRTTVSPEGAEEPATMCVQCALRMMTAAVQSLNRALSRRHVIRGPSSPPSPTS